MAKNVKPGNIGSPKPTYPWSDGWARGKAQPVYNSDVLLSLRSVNAGNPAYKYWDFAAAYRGAFIFSDTDGNRPSNYTAWQRLGPGVTANRIFATTQLGTHWFGEYNIPTLSMSNSQSAWPVASLVQGHRSAWNDPATKPSFQEPRIGGLYYDPPSNDLYVQLVDSYGQQANSSNQLRYTDGNNIAASPVVGMYNAGGGRHAHGAPIPIPIEFQGLLGGTHMMVSGGIMSIDDSTTCGPSVFVLPSLGAVNSAITAMDFPVATPLSVLDPANPGADLNHAQMWNHLSGVSGAFIYPGTRTLVCLGENIDLSVPGNYVIYHAYDDAGFFADGHNPYKHDAWLRYYWLFDLNRLIATVANPAANPPHLTTPYEYGALPSFGSFATWQQKLTGASFDPRNNRVTVSLQYGGSPRFTSSPSQHQFEVT